MNWQMPALRFLALTAVTFLALELITLPMRDRIVETASAMLHSVIRGNYNVSWECTALDEVFLLAAAIWWAEDDKKAAARKVLVGVLVLVTYNIIRIAILARHPSEVLHDVLFRWGGFVLILVLFYALEKKAYKQGKAI